MKRTFPGNLITFITSVIIGFVLVVIGLRVILKLFGANPFIPFVDWVYDTSASLISPFAGIFPTPVLDGAFIIEFSSLFALIVYSLLAYLIYQLVDFLTYAAERRVDYREGAVFGARRDEEEEEKLLEDEDERPLGRGRRTRRGRR